MRAISPGAPQHTTGTRGAAHHGSRPASAFRWTLGPSKTPLSAASNGYGVLAESGFAHRLVPMDSVRNCSPGRFRRGSLIRKTFIMRNAARQRPPARETHARAPRPWAFSVHQVVVKLVCVRRYALAQHRFSVRQDAGSLLNLSSEILVMVGEKARQRFSLSCQRAFFARPRRFSLACANNGSRGDSRGRAAILWPLDARFCSTVGATCVLDGLCAFVSTWDGRRMFRCSHGQDGPPVAGSPSDSFFCVRF